MRSPEGTLLRTDWRVLRDGRAWLLVAMTIGPLVAMAWREALTTYAEMSGTPGDAAALTSALSPLDGIVAPIFGAYAVVATLLFPFVAIRALAEEKASGALMLLLQAPVPIWRHIIVKFITLVLTWMLWWIPGLLALALWRAHGGHLSASETAGVLLGHLLHGAFIAALGLACAALTESAASAAVVALGVTLGGWAIDFTASVRGGLAATLAPYTPDAMLRTFEHGLLAGHVLLVSLVLLATCLGLAILWTDPAMPRRRTLWRSALLGVAAAAGLAVGSRTSMAWDVSEDRRNSFATADADALAAISAPLRITVYLGPSDPRRADLERDVLNKLRRVMPDVHIAYAAQSSTGLFAGRRSQYGEIWYAIGDQRVMSRSTTPAIVLETIYQLAGRTPPEAAPSTYPGYPAHIAVSTWEWLLLLAGWPLLVLGWWWSGRSNFTRKTGHNA